MRGVAGLCEALSGAVAELLLTAVGVNSIPAIKGLVKNGDEPDIVYA